MEPRIGVYICHCGSNIAGTVDVEEVVEFARGLDSVVVARDYIFMCSDPGQEVIRNDIRDFGLNRVVVAACSPQMHEATFRRVCQEAGLNPYLFEMANIREHCSWVTEDKQQATEKAKALVSAAVKRVYYHQPLVTREVPFNPNTLIVGGGIAGIQAALEIADSEHKVYLVERTPSIGGHMIQLDKTFPTLDCSACILTPKMTQVGSHPYIELMTYSEVEEISGFIGNFKVKIRKKARYVDADKCTSCGLCQEKCPWKVDSEFDVGIGKRKAIYIPFEQAVPNIPVIDREHCVYFLKGTCRACEKVCEPKAINFEQEDKVVEVEVGAIILATGFNVFDSTPIYQYGYKRLDNVISSLEFERLVNSSGPTEGNIVLKGGSTPQSIAIVHCVGSRDKNYHEYCSRVCCMYALKYAHLVKEKIGNAEVYQFYIDMRSFGKGYEEFYERLSVEGVNFIRGKVGEITDQAINEEEKGKLVVVAEDTLLGAIIRVPVDMVILCVAMEPQPDAEAVGRLFNVSRSADGFFLEKHPKLDPVATTTDGVFIAGCCQGPKDIPDTVAQASAAAARVLAMISKGRVEIEAATAVIDERICSGCQICYLVCPYSAISFDEEKEVCRVNEALCKGCGACVSGCFSDAISLNHFNNEQILAEMEGMLV
ncbi:MAG: CoB--CoM heterodisulfide reductase iron-sulfur subunit A family protein [Dehalococcoidia bacterium]|nr:MAG: CoB--CoM heterodisulfide reductase iron-sulfur subunit A family protein [Dehalococcoidia bacterium]